MPIKVGPGRIPIILNDYSYIENGVKCEIFLDYENADIYYIDKEGNTVALTKDIRTQIENIAFNSAKIHIIELGQPIPPLQDREENNFYLIVEKEKQII